MSKDYVTIQVQRDELADIVTALNELAWGEALSGEESRAVDLATLAQELTRQEAWQS